MNYSNQNNHNNFKNFCLFVILLNLINGCANTQQLQSKIQLLKSKITELNKIIENPDSKVNKIISEAKKKAEKDYSQKIEIATEESKKIIEEAKMQANEIINISKDEARINVRKITTNILNEAHDKAKKIIIDANRTANKKIDMLISEAQKKIKDVKNKKNLKKEVSKHILKIKLKEKPKALFGLYWGATKSEIEALGVKLTKEGQDKTFYYYKTSSLPKNLKDSNYYLLIFEKNKNLQKIVMISNHIDDTLSGLKGRERYNYLKKLLSNDYEHKLSFEKVGMKLFDKYDEFYECLGYKGCGSWGSIFENDQNAGVVLELLPVRKGIGYIKITAEGPEWSTILDKDEEKIRLMEDEAL